MAIVPLVKATVYGPAPEKGEVLDGLQQLGCLHLIDLRGAAGDGGGRPAAEADARAALRYLKDSPVRRHVPRHMASVDIPKLVRDVLDVLDRSRALAEEREQLRRWIAEVEPWGDFELPDWAREGALRFWLYALPHHGMRRLQGLEHPWQVAARDQRFAYVAVVSPEQPTDMPVAPLALEPRSLSALRERFAQVERELEELDYKRIGLTLYRKQLAAALSEADDRAARERAAQGALERDQVFAVQGWAPVDHAQALREFVAGRGLAVTIEAPGAGDAPPTLLDNPAALRGGEALVNFYKTPAYSSWDPSRAVLFAFAGFFAMILADAGYGVVLGWITLASWRRMGLTSGGRAMRGVFVALVVASIAYGVAVGSYFGTTPPLGSWRAKLRVLDAADQGLMIWLTIAIGAVHIAAANLLTAWRRRRSLSALAALGWSGMVLSGLAAGLGSTYPTFAPLLRVGLGGAAGGALCVLLFSSERRFSLAPRAVAGRLAEGLKSLADLSKAFGDVLSYLRLFALGLASIKLGEVFNGLAGDAFEFGGAGMLLGLVVLLVGHGINFAMGIMSGVVHGLRLNLIEFFNWSLPEEGESFRAFAKTAKR